MSDKTLKIKVFHFDPTVHNKPYYKTYDVPFTEGMSAMTALDYIYQNLDSTLAYYDHAGCDLGICARCTAKINGKVGLLCQTLLSADSILEPVSEKNVLKDLVTKKR
jgi:fumarate reductase iron-sulfur subunit